MAKPVVPKNVIKARITFNFFIFALLVSVTKTAVMDKTFTEPSGLQDEKGPERPDKHGFKSMKEIRLIAKETQRLG